MSILRKYRFAITLFTVMLILFILINIWPNRGTVDIYMHNGTNNSIMIRTNESQPSTLTLAPFESANIPYEIDFSGQDISIALDSAFLTKEKQVLLFEYVEPAYYGNINVTILEDNTINDLIINSDASVKF
ncbi:hypothetical protein EDC19_1540 [Natranaerovirga hydrolytica]|uniref:Uncharacterized protein n=2 Tax=Natranaerovirga hydrolytica TaxID=680378 RepID=A0A4R1MKJ5_9FIRM|nr:hypothetical protein EDC19_1540 [Natranaerovirga hydrolytica]